MCPDSPQYEEADPADSLTAYGMGTQFTTQYYIPNFEAWMNGPADSQVGTPGLKTQTWKVTKRVQISWSEGDRAPSPAESIELIKTVFQPGTVTYVVPNGDPIEE